MPHALAENLLRPVPQPFRARVEPETPAEAEGVDALIMAAFGPGRFAKTAERLREGSSPAAGFVVLQDGRVVGSVRLWPVLIGQARGLFLGPIAVDATHRSDGLGADLVQACIGHAREAAAAGVLLVGDRAYFERFGFVGAPEAVLPGPVDQTRVLWLPLGAELAAGVVRIA